MSIWIPVSIRETKPHTYETTDLTQGQTVYVDVEPAWRGPHRKPKPIPFNGGRIMLTWLRRDDDEPWTLPEYANWLAGGCPTDWSGDARID